MSQATFIIQDVATGLYVAAPPSVQLFTQHRPHAAAYDVIEAARRAEELMESHPAGFRLVQAESSALFYS